MKSLDLFGKATPTKVLSWALFVAGVTGLIASRMVDSDRDWWLGAAVIMIGLSMVLDAVLPGGSELSDEQVALVRHVGIPKPNIAQKLLSLVLGLPLIAWGCWLLT